ncbi:MAG: phosphotransferase [Bdellovibrionota bacterium]
MTTFSIFLEQDAEPLLFNFTQFKIVTHHNKTAEINEPALELIAGDASDRKFFRLINNKEDNAICMQFPKWEGGYGGDPISWIGMHNALSKMGLPVPKILEIDETNACIWTQDLGNNFLNSILKEECLDASKPECAAAVEYYKQALSLLVQAQYPNVTIDHPASNRFFNFEKLYYEMNFFVTHFLNGLLHLDVDENDKSWSGLFDNFNLLCKKLETYDKVLCHRDYHVRNIMIQDKMLYWIDFQDARMGPHAYDVVSLVRDSYVEVTWKTRELLFSYYLNALNSRREKFGLKAISFADFHLELLLMGLQRNIKALGSFGYLAIKKSKPEYLKYVIHTLKILCSKNSQVHEETDLKRLFPHIFELLDNLLNGKYSKKLNKIIDRVK